MTRVLGLVRGDLRNIGRDPILILIATLPFVIYGMFRYLYLAYRKDGGGDPAATLLRDWPSLLNVLLYLVVVLLAVGSHGP